MKFLSNASFKTSGASLSATSLEFPVIKSFDSADPDAEPVVGQLYFRQGNSNSELRVYTGVNSKSWKTINTTNIASDVTWGQKGQLIVSTGNDTAATLNSDQTSGNGEVLMVDNTVSTTGLKWSKIGVTNLNATGTASSLTFLRGDNAWERPTLTTDLVWTAKGQIAAATGSGTATTINVGASNTVLIPDTLTATGLKWAQLPVDSILTTTGTAGSTTFLRGDGAWATPAGGGGDVATDTIWNAKGDLAVGTGADTASVLTVGADNTLLIADSTGGGGTVGVKWAKVPLSSLDTSNSPSSNTFLKGDGSWAVPAGGGGGTAVDDASNIIANQVFS